MSTLIESVRQGEREVVADATAEYAALLLRNEHPEEGDATRLVEVMAALGKSGADLESDLAVLAHAADLQRVADDLPAAEAAQREAAAAFDESEARRAETLKALDGERGERQMAMLSAQQRVKAARGAGGELAQLRRRSAALFGLPVEAPPPEPKAGMTIGPSVLSPEAEEAERRRQESLPRFTNVGFERPAGD